MYLYLFGHISEMQPKHMLDFNKKIKNKQEEVVRTNLKRLGGVFMRLQDNFKKAAWLKVFIKIHDVFKFPFLPSERISLK